MLPGYIQSQAGIKIGARLGRNASFENSVKKQVIR